MGVSDLLKEINGGSSKDLSKVLIGDGMIIFAQIIVAAQMVIEEKFVNGKNIHPLRFIYWLENISKIHALSGMLYENFGGVKYDITSFLTAILTFLNPNVDILNSPLTFIDFLAANRPNYWVRQNVTLSLNSKMIILGPLDGKDFLVQ